MRALRQAREVSDLFRQGVLSAAERANPVPTDERVLIDSENDGSKPRTAGRPVVKARGSPEGLPFGVGGDNGDRVRKDNSMESAGTG